MSVLHDLSDITSEPDAIEEDGDIYRGEAPVLPRSPSPESIVSASSSSSSSSSSGSFITGGRIGALAAVVEHAITRWARRNSSASSSSSNSTRSTSSLRSSVFTLSRPRQARRRRRRSSSANLHSAASERDIAARLRARQESRQIPREFTLYLPPSLCPDSAQLSALPSTQPNEYISHSSSLPLILSELETALRKPSRARRNREKSRQQTTSSSGSAQHQDSLLPESLRAPSRPASFTDLDGFRAARKGKQKEIPHPIPEVPKMSIFGATHEVRRAPKAWWLDVASPSWDDMRSIGKLLHLHPLTLEDILQQEPREKLEVFTRLGYYFIVFRALENPAVRERFRRNQVEGDDLLNSEGAIGEANVYLVVFREGICTFHFTDISEHIDRVRNRVKLLQDSFHMSSDWIAHGLLDSVVDSFFPPLKEIEKEVAAVEALVFSTDDTTDAASVETLAPSDDLAHISVDNPSGQKKDAEKLPITDEKGDFPGDPTASLRTRFSLPRPTRPLFFRQLKRNMYSILEFFASARKVRTKQSQTATVVTLRRMARTRRLVTSLSRLLATKSEVVSQIRKRFFTAGQQSGNRAGQSDDIEIAIHMGDVQDHIITLQQALSHYERTLSDSHPAYLFQLRMNVSTAKSGTDKSVMMLTVISLGVVCIQVVIGIFSMNVTIPANSIVPPGPYYWFGIVIVLSVLVECCFLGLVRYWWNQAKRRPGSLE
ncbi:hypothetical protein BV22DRAFT_1195365 [Leucogyrophana mollusca]|uniref:Uncharacterized protein n=1 Tax=Leucogyrophana mollusca TaxID=85980 RepID=A0ACB8BIM6_9AGAM|nr:hypothetical protein BV22DRAFT_1195365 [Leucogyrophana mollusca]